MDSEDRAQVVKALEAIDEANREFDRLVGMEGKAELLEELERRSKGDLRELLFARVLIEQQRRRDRSRGD
jgi:hypothetical protein